eukprot:s3825_g4.t1
MADRSDSWDVFLCHGSCETFDAAIPRSMLAVYPEVVANSTVIAYKEFGSSICPRYHQGKNCNNRTNCLHFHPDFINDHWMVPDFICHWFQGTCEYPNSCWNQHGMTFDSALRMAFNIQLASRGRHPPVQFRSADGGTMRQTNRADAERIIMATMRVCQLAQIQLRLLCVLCDWEWLKGAFQKKHHAAQSHKSENS